MRYADIKYCDSGNGAGVRTSLFVSGCNRHCPGCFNEEAWSFSYGHEFTEDTKKAIIESLAPDYVSGLSVLGGEPMEPANRDALIDLLWNVRREYPAKTIWLFTGYSFEALWAASSKSAAINEILKYVDVLKDGAFVQEAYNASLQFRGSSNQRLIDIPASFASGETVLWVDSFGD